MSLKTNQPCGHPFGCIHHDSEKGEGYCCACRMGALEKEVDDLQSDKMILDWIDNQGDDLFDVLKRRKICANQNPSGYVGSSVIRRILFEEVVSRYVDKHRALPE